MSLTSVQRIPPFQIFPKVVEEVKIRVFIVALGLVQERLIIEHQLTHCHAKQSYFAGAFVHRFYSPGRSYK